MTTLPDRLWRDETLNLPACLCDHYRTELEQRALYEEAMKPDPGKLIGGEEEDLTQQHFCHRFPTSSVRTEYLLVDPRGNFAEVSRGLRVAFFEGTVAVLDVPCGTGAGFLGLLATIADLRSDSTLPPLPLTVQLTGGDYSARALEIYESILNRIAPALALHQIDLRWTLLPWNAEHEETTARLVDGWFAASTDADEHIALISAFSGATHEMFDPFKRSFQHIMSRMYSRRGCSLWVEPGTKDAETFFKKIGELFQSLTSRFLSLGADIAREEFYWRHPFKGDRIRGTVRVRRYDRQ